MPDTYSLQLLTERYNLSQQHTVISTKIIRHSCFTLLTRVEIWFQRNSLGRRKNITCIIIME